MFVLSDRWFSFSSWFSVECNLFVDWITSSVNDGRCIVRSISTMSWISWWTSIWWGTNWRASNTWCSTNTYLSSMELVFIKSFLLAPAIWEMVGMLAGWWFIFNWSSFSRTYFIVVYFPYTISLSCTDKSLTKRIWFATEVVKTDTEQA